MMENNCPRVSPSESTETDSSIMKRRKKRQWDQPADSLVSMGTVLPGILPLSNMGFLAAITSPGIPTIPNVNFNNSLASTGATLMSVLQAPLPQNGAAIVQKLNQPKIQDELIAREIVINDADSALRYKLTKRQTQEEIQKCTNAIVITRGKYRPPTAPLDGEKPLYLHISAGAHLETTVERIKAVDSAAAMVEEILKNGCSNNGVKVNNSSSACVFLGFEADPSLDIAARIRGPNDQYVNHIMNETGATILLKGRGSGNSASIEADDGQQPLHLFLSSSNSKNLERAKLLAENLLDTISAEFGASRVSSSKVYGAVPPPPQLLAGVQSSGAAPPQNNLSTVSLAASTSISVSSVVSPVIVCSASDVASQGIVPPHPGWSSSGQSLANTCSNSSLTHGTSYIGYGGIYPQATPLQQVAQVLRQSTSPVTATVGPVSTAGCLTSHTTAGSSLEKDKRSAQKRKFQELPAAVKRPSNLNQNVLQGSELPKLRDLTSNFGARDISNIPASRELIDEPSTSVMLPPPSRRISPSPLPPPSLKFNSTSMPPPPPKFSSALGVRDSKSAATESRAEIVPDTLVKLLEYGDDDDDDDEPAKVSEESLKRNSTDAPKPFWAV